MVIVHMHEGRNLKRGGEDVGALRLSLWGCDHFVSRNPNESHCDEDKHKAPTPPHIRPLSLQDGGDPFPFITSSGCQRPSGRMRTFPIITLFDCKVHQSKPRRVSGVVNSYARNFSSKICDSGAR
jgi:hypothetical protein